jgi:hypothetical protein
MVVVLFERCCVNGTLDGTESENDQDFRRANPRPLDGIGVSDYIGIV